MKAEYIQLSYLQVMMATILILANGLISLFLRLNLGRRIVIASIRTVVQLLLVGLVLDQVFDVRSVFLVLAMMGVMTVIAGFAAVRRTEHRYSGVWLNTFLSVWASSWMITVLALIAIVQVEPWYRPQYAIPLLGMVLGNSLTGVSLGLDRMGDELVRGRDTVELVLALGGTSWEAAHRPISTAVRTGLIPTLNSMAVVGIVSLPGMMTGQLLAGVDPIEAVKYQVVMMFLIASGTALGTVSAVLLTYRSLFNSRNQFDHLALTSTVR
ncbi:MAG: iron export ABC transporter permease subunit FetB [Pirellulaceae bacterium]|nr:iron export ABC transporter permease subunit FetB [Pirellulaceae bacterium]